ncbi:MAG: hypothetical protein WBD25_10445 [Terriglobales bacterium]
MRIFPLAILLVLPGIAQQKSANTKAEPVGLQVAEKTPDSAARLPVKRVVLYKNGIGYFEHTARVHGTQDLRIDFTTGQLNDVLKSLTAVDTGDGRISSVRYNFDRAPQRTAQVIASALRPADYECRFPECAAGNAD